MTLAALALPAPDSDATEPKNVGERVGEMDRGQLKTLPIEAAHENRG